MIGLLSGQNGGVRLPHRRLPAALAVLGLAAALTVAVPSGREAAGAEAYPRPSGGVLEFVGRGYGHGRGMSQWGAYGAARQGRSHEAILATYYPGTHLTRWRGRETVRVRLTTQGARPVDVPTAVAPASALRWRAASGTWRELPGKWQKERVDQWAAKRAADGSFELWGRAGKWQRYAGRLPAPVEFAAASGLVRVVLPGGSSRDYRGRVAAVALGRASITVNTLGLEDYLRSVVPSEMPAAWPAEALKAQAVAARTYAVHDMASAAGRPWDVYDNVRNQVFGGVRSYDASGRRVRNYEAARPDSAVAATARRIVVDRAGKVAFTQFSASNGGWQSAGSAPYLIARPDPWDGALDNPVHTWTTQIRVGDADAALGVGTVRRVVVTSRDRCGRATAPASCAWGGRITGVRVEGSARTRVLTGVDMRRALGLRSEWWSLLAPPAPPRSLTARGGSRRIVVSWAAPPATGGAPVTAYVVTVGDGRRVVPATARTVTVHGLRRGVVYPVSVQAGNRIGVGLAARARAVPR